MSITARGIRAGRAFVELFADDTRLTRGLKAAQRKLQAFGASVKNLGASMARVGAVSALPFALATKVFSDFDDQMREVKAVTQANEDEFQRLTSVAKELGRTTSFTAAQVAGLMAELGRAGFSPKQVEDMTAAVLDLSRATKTDATLASGIMAASIRQFGLEASDAVRVADSLTIAANKSFNSVETLGEALSYAGPVAADFNMSIEDTLAVLGALGNVGIQGSNAGTALRRLLTITGAQADKLRGIFGVSFMDAAGNARPLVDVLGEVNAATKGLGTAARSAKFNEAFGLLGVTGASAIGKSAASAKELAVAIKGSGGAAAKAAKEMDAGIGGATRRLLSAIEGIAIAIGESLAPVLSEWAENLSAVSAAITAIIRNNRQLVTAIFKVIAVVFAVGAGLMAIGASSLLMGAALGGVMNVIVFTGKALAVAGKAMFLFGRSAMFVIRILSLGIGTIANFAVTLMRTLVAAVVSGVTAMVSAVASAGTSLAAIAAMITPIGALGIALAALAAIFVVQSDIIGSAISQLSSLWKLMKQDAIDSFNGVIEALKKGDLKLAMEIIWLGIKMEWIRGVNFLKSVWGEFSEFFLNTWTNASSNLSMVFLESVSLMQSAWASLVAFMTKTIRTVSAMFFEGVVQGMLLTGKIDENTANAMRTVAGVGMQAQLNADNKAAQDAQDEIESKRQAALGANEEMRQGQMDQHAANRAKMEAESAAALDAARKEWRAAIDKASATTKDIGDQQDRVSRAKRSAGGAGRMGADFDLGSSSSAGTFNAFAASSLGTSSVAQRQLDELQKITKNTKDAKKEAIFE